MGIRKDIAAYIKSCSECYRYKAPNQKPSLLFQTTVYAEHFETLSTDFFGSFSKTPSAEKWILIAYDFSMKWTELFPLKEETVRSNDSFGRSCPLIWITAKNNQR